MITPERLARWYAAEALDLERKAELSPEESAALAAETAETLADRDRMRGPLKTARTLAAKLREVSDPDTDGDTFALAEGLYYFATWNHGGQWSRLYSVACVLERSPIRFRPGAAASGPEPGGGGERIARYLERKARRNYGGAEDMAEDARDILSALCWTDPEGGAE